MVVTKKKEKKVKQNGNAQETPTPPPPVSEQNKKLSERMNVKPSDEFRSRFKRPPQIMPEGAKDLEGYAERSFAAVSFFLN